MVQLHKAPLVAVTTLLNCERALELNWKINLSEYNLQQFCIVELQKAPLVAVTTLLNCERVLELNCKINRYI